MPWTKEKIVGSTKIAGLNLGFFFPMGQSSNMEWGVNDPRNVKNNLVIEWKLGEKDEQAWGEWYLYQIIRVKET